MRETFKTLFCSALDSKNLFSTQRYMNKRLPKGIVCYTVEEFNAHPVIDESTEYTPDNYLIITDDLDLEFDIQQILGTAYLMEYDFGQWQFQITTYPESPTRGVKLFLEKMEDAAYDHKYPNGYVPPKPKKKPKLFSILLVALTLIALYFYVQTGYTILEQVENGALSPEIASELRIKIGFLMATIVIFTISHIKRNR